MREEVRANNVPPPANCARFHQMWKSNPDTVPMVWGIKTLWDPQLDKNLVPLN
jgi:hypothetical protein